jgi:hypothetical protein
MDETPELQLTIRPNIAEVTAFSLRHSDIVTLAGLSTETGMDYLVNKILSAHPNLLSLREALHTPQTVIEAQVGNFTRTLRSSPALSAEIVQIYLTALQQAFELKHGELDIVMAIDAIRDNFSEPAAMLDEIVSLLVERLAADCCLLYLLDRKTGQATLQAVKVRKQKVGRPEELIPFELVERALQLDRAASWVGQEMLTQHEADAPEMWQLAAVPVIMGTEERLGALLLARAAQPFSSNDLQLLETAEDHIDSAIIQIRVDEEKRRSEESLALKHKELAMIQAIDTIRDAGLEPAEML